MDVEIVHHEYDRGRFRVNLVGEAAEKPGHVDDGATLSRFEHAGAGERLDGGKDIRRTASLVLVIDSGRRPGRRWDGVRVCSRSCLLVSSRHTCGRAGS